ncbi:hypothetical protein FOF52_05480 [Thermobifida alba]|uniref:Uncharacterized protein n=1 Tax=Thermobifida alba TaxID=53522 RepID=A0ABY4KYI9_THEAE|nr:hypothetical protein [Thermobifida alba]UPT20490.1 hypothetical protein FOF52_05480 [Thermobifida alba]HLU95918.1 hypothetical protein [Thermobifida alba]
MARVVFCHGIGHTYRHREDIRESWYEALCRGMVDVGLQPLGYDEVAAVYYGNCFRSRSAKQVVAADEFSFLPNYGPRDLGSPLELELLEAFAGGVAEERGTKGLVQGALRRLESSRFLGDVPAKAVIWFIKQVHRYLTEEQLRDAVLARWDRVVTEETRVVVGHSLGSVVAYEALRAHPEWRIDTLVTLGSPLGLRAIYSRLRPPVAPGDVDAWPGVRRWVNVAAVEDPVSLVKKLSPIYGGGVEDTLVSNGRFAAHSVVRYLTTAEAVEGIADGLVRG